MSEELDAILGGEYTNLPSDMHTAFLVFEHRVSIKYDIQNSPHIDDRRMYIQDIQSFLLEFNFDVSEDFFLSPLSINQNAATFEKFHILVTGLANSIKARVAKERSSGTLETVNILNSQKSEIRDLVDAIKRLIDKVDLETRKKDSLFGKLNSFLDELDKEVTRLTSILSAMVEISTATGDAAEELERAMPLFERMLRLFGLSAEKQGRLPPWEEQKQIEPPPKQIEDKRKSNGNDTIAPE